MSNEKKLRLLQVAKEFKVGIATITDFLAKKGVHIESSPNTLVEPDVYAVLAKEFGGNRSANERVNVRERINLKPESVSLHDKKDSPRAHDSEFEEEVVIKSGVISARDEIRTGPKIVGKIDLSGGNRKPAAPQPAAAKKEEPKGSPVQPAKQESAKPVPSPAPQPKTPVDSKESVSEKPAASQPQPEAPTAGTRPAGEPAAPKPETDTATAAKPEIVIQEKTYDQRMAENRDNVFRPSDETKLTGPKVLGKMDVQSLGPAGGRREKRKRIGKDKVDVTKQQPSGPGARGGQGPRDGQGGGRGAAQGPQSRKDRKKKGAPKPVVRPEVSDEEVSKQIKDTLARLTSKGGKNKGAQYRKEKRLDARARMDEAMEKAHMEESILKVTEFVTVSELATMMDVPVTEVITACMNLGLMVSINQRLDAEALVIVAEEFGFKVEFVTVDIQEAIDEDRDDEQDLVERPPIVAVMGHVDHGKTSLLDNIRKTNVIEGEAGGITQHIGAYSVDLNGKKITFLDTPGHEAFTAMRARGAKVTDVAIIIVAADDSVMPQTVEAINHASAAGVPIVFAINKIDKPGANPEAIKEQLAQMNYLVEDWGGKYQSQEISAKKGINLDKLLEKVLLEAELLELKANPDRKATGTVIESTLDKGRGYVATLLVQNGTLHIGDPMVAGVYSGKVKAMFNERGQKVTAAPPATPVLVLGLNGAPQAGDTFNVMEDERSAREVANKREQLQRIQGLKTQKHVTLDEIGRRIAIGNFKELNIIVKGDVDGSIEAMTDSLIKLSTEEVQVNVIHKAVGQISESDVMLAMASNAIIVGFQVRPSGGGPPHGREGGDRDKALLHHLRRHQRHQGRHRRYARTGEEGGNRMFGRGTRNVQNHQGRCRGGLRSTGREDNQKYPHPRHPRRYRHPYGPSRFAQTFQRRRQGGIGRYGVRSQHRKLQRCPCRRLHRRLRNRGGETQTLIHGAVPIGTAERQKAGYHCIRPFCVVNSRDDRRYGQVPSSASGADGKERPE